MEPDVLVIKVEVWPAGEEAQAREIALAHVWNTGDHEHAPALGNYDSLWRSRERDLRAQVRDWPRLEEDCWSLVRALLNQGQA